MKEIQLIDTHAHLPMLTHSELSEVLSRAKEQGIVKMVTVSTDPSNWESNRRLAETYSHLYYTLGLHPHDATRWPECAPTFMNLCPPGSPPPAKMVAIGEMGLDFHYEFSPREIQIPVFESQLKLSHDMNLPVIIHCRDAFTELFESLHRVGLSSRGGVLHCFTGTLSEAQVALEFGLKISFSGILTFKTAKDLRETAKQIPGSEILIETDCPYLAPLPNRGKPNEPAYLPLTAACLAETRGVALEEIAEQTTQNAIEFFQL